MKELTEFALVLSGLAFMVESLVTGMIPNRSLTTKVI